MNKINRSTQFDVKTNVCIREFSQTGELLNEIHQSNRVTKIALLDLVKFTGGYINPSVPDYKTYLSQGFPYYPRYLALGTNVAGAGTSGDGVKTIVDVNDSHLLSEITEKDSNKSIRIPLQQNNTITNLYSDPYIKLTLKCLVQSNIFESYGDTTLEIREAGLFTESSGNNCWARIVFDKIDKDPNSVLDITWDLVFISLVSEGVPYEDLGSEDQKALRALIESYSDLKKEDYTTDSWNNYSNVLNMATAVLEYTDSNSYNLKKAYTDLENAKNQLVEN